MYKYTNNPLDKKNVHPRPDFVILKDGEVKGILYTKYRDLWNRSLPREMLYQLSLYSLSGTKNATSRYSACLYSWYVRAY